MPEKIDWIYGTGLSFPFEMENGKPKLITGVELIRHSLVNLLAWEYGRRYFMGHFGTKINRLLEQPADDVTVTLIREYIIEAINRFEKRISLISADIQTRDETIDVILRYQVIDDNTVDSFIVPMYTSIQY